MLLPEKLEKCVASPYHLYFQQVVKLTDGYNSGKTLIPSL